MTRTTEVNRGTMAIDSDSPVHAARQSRFSHFITDDIGNPAGGQSVGEGFQIQWQNGVLQPNGAILEDVIQSCVERLMFFQGSLPELAGVEGANKFACRENALAITHLEEALHWLNHRTLSRRARGVEGSYKA